MLTTTEGRITINSLSLQTLPQRKIQRIFFRMCLYPKHFQGISNNRRQDRIWQIPRNRKVQKSELFARQSCRSRTLVGGGRLSGLAEKDEVTIVLLLSAGLLLQPLVLQRVLEKSAVIASSPHDDPSEPSGEGGCWAPTSLTRSGILLLVEGSQLYELVVHDITEVTEYPGKAAIRFYCHHSWRISRV
jgi:hypothetical protein